MSANKNKKLMGVDKEILPVDIKIISKGMMAKPKIIHIGINRQFLHSLIKGGLVAWT